MLQHAIALLVLTVSAGAGTEAPVARNDVPPGEWSLAADLPGAPGWDALQARHPGSWSVYTDLSTGAPSLIAGPPIPAGMPVRADDAGVARARAFLEELRDVLRVDDPAAFAVERVTTVTNPHGQELVIVHLKQTWNGLDIRHQSEGGDREKRASVFFVFKGGHVVMLGSDAVPALALPAETRLDEAGALSRALGSAEVGPAALKRVESRSYVSVRGSRAFLAREVEVVTSEPEHRWRFVFDAHTGALEEQRDDLRHVDYLGNVKAGSVDFPGGAFQQRPQRALRVNIGTGGFGITDINGDWRVPNSSPQSVLIGGRFLGDWAVVQDQSGSNLNFVSVATPGVPTNVIMNPFHMTEFESAEAAAYHWATTTRFSIQAYYPSFNGLAALPINVNLNSFCGATWDGTSLNFRRAGNGCNNTAYGEAVAHEYGHAFHEWFYGSTTPDGFSEGIADHIGYVVSRSREMPRNWYTNGTPLRDYRPGGAANLTQWPCSNCPDSLRGQVWAGFTMDLYDNLVAAHGPAAGSLLWHQITIPAYGYLPTDEAYALWAVYSLDDDDFDLANGTPNCASITAAARRHSLPLPWRLPSSPCGADLRPPSPEYRSPVLEAGLSGAAYDASPALSSNGLTVWFVSNRAGGVGGLDIWTATRPSISAAWSAPALVPNVNSANTEIAVAVNDIGTEMFITTDRPGGAGGYDLWRSTRVTVFNPWSVPVPASGVNTASHDMDATITGDGSQLFFSSNRAGTFDIYGATRSGTANFVNLRLQFNQSFQEGGCAVSSDGLKLFMSWNFEGNYNYTINRRTAAFDTFGNIARTLTELNTSTNELRGDETSDGFSFYFSRIGNVGPSANIYRADRIQPKLNGPRSGAAGTTPDFFLRRDPGDVGSIVLGVDAIPPTPVPPVVGELGIVPLLTLVTAVHDANGLVRWTTTAPNAPGVMLWLQGISQDPGGTYYLSDRLSFLLLP